MRYFEGFGSLVCFSSCLKKPSSNHALGETQAVPRLRLKCQTRVLSLGAVASRASGSVGPGVPFYSRGVGRKLLEASHRHVCSPVA